MHGRAGVNRVSFRGRVGGRMLAPGSYRIRARALSSGRALTETRLVIFKRKPLHAELAAAQASNTCRSDTSKETAAPGTSAGAGAAAARSARTGGKQSGGVIQVEGADGPQGRGLPAGVLGVQFSRAAEAVKKIHPLLYVLLGMAIALLGLAAIPIRYVPNARLAALLAYRRSTVAIAGAAALAAVSVMYVLG